MKPLSLFVYIFLCFFVLLYCSPRSTNRSELSSTANSEKDRYPADLLNQLPGCSGNDCCSEHRECQKLCENLFEHSEERKKITAQCELLPRDTVEKLDTSIQIILRHPRIDEITIAAIREQLQVILALDYYILIDLFMDYTIIDAKQMLIWFAEEKFVAEELSKLPSEYIYHTLYELLSSSGDRTLPDSVENGLSEKISFEETFFQLLIHYDNDKMLQMTHDMIRDRLCENYSPESDQNALCTLRIYCREIREKGTDGISVHSEETRNLIAERLEDKLFFEYIAADALHVGFGVGYLRPVINNQVCFNVCKDIRKGCR